MALRTPVAVDVVVNRLRLRLWDHAPDRPDLPVVLCLHGALDTGRSFDATAEEVGDAARVLAFDLRGHGASAHVGDGGSYHLLDFLKDLGLYALTSGHKIDVVVGHSMGGNLALMLVGAMPSVCQHLILVDSVGPPPEDPADQPERIGELITSLVEKEKKAFAPAASLSAAIERLQKWNPGLSTEAARRMVEPVLVERDGALHFPFDPRVRGPTPFRWPEPFYASCCARFAHETKRGVTTTTILRATDGFVPAGDGGALLASPYAERAAVLRADVEVVAGGHHVHVEHPDAVARAIKKALA